MTRCKEVLLVGLGAVGTIYAFILKNSGAVRVTVVARSNYDLVKDRGIDIKSAKFGEHLRWQPDRLCRSVADAADTEYAFVFVVTKCVPEVMKTSQLLEPLISSEFKQPTYALVQNGLGVERDLYDAIHATGATPSVVSVAAFIYANHMEPHLVEHGMDERFVCGIYRPGDYTTMTHLESESAMLNELGNILRAGGGDVEIVPEIQRKKFFKNMYNVVFASICLLTRYPLMAIFRPPPSDGQQYEPFLYPATSQLVEEFTVPLLRSMFDELLSLARALGFPDNPEGLPSSAIDTALTSTRRVHEVASSFHKPSTLLDCEKGAPMEIEVIWGSVVRLARERHLNLPRVEMAYSLLVILQNQTLRNINT